VRALAAVHDELLASDTFCRRWMGGSGCAQQAGNLEVFPPWKADYDPRAP
jgi:hypothetical protein